ncbi:MAG: dTDP-4-dehydrorhamnose 3,5-epimerase [Candidatus Kapaibacterium sp.]
MSFTIEEIIFDAIKIMRSPIHSDHRGFFEEVYRADACIRNGIPTDFIQDNHSRSRRGVIRGMHAQYNAPMGKLLHVMRGQIQLVEVDVRAGSPTFGQHVSIDVSDVNGRTVWIPPGFANGFAVLSDEADVHYKCTALYNPQTEFGINPMDAQLGIRWLVDDPILSDKDLAAMSFSDYASDPKF